MNKVYTVCTCREGRELSRPECQCMSSVTPQCCVCALGLGGLEGCSGGHSSTLVLMRAEHDFSPPWCSLWLICLCFEPLVFSPVVYSDLVLMLLFKFLPLTCNPCLSCLFISVCTAFPPCVCSAPSCDAWANTLFFAGKTLFWVVGGFIPYLFPAIITFLCSDCAGFSSSSHAHLAGTPCMFIWELYSFTQSWKANAVSSSWSGK